MSNAASLVSITGHPYRDVDRDEISDALALVPKSSFYILKIAGSTDWSLFGSLPYLQSMILVFAITFVTPY